MIALKKTQKSICNLQKMQIGHAFPSLCSKTERTEEALLCGVGEVLQKMQQLSSNRCNQDPSRKYSAFHPKKMPEQ